MTPRKAKNNIAITETYTGAKGALMETFKKQNIVEQEGYFQIASHIYSWLGPSNYMAYSYALDVMDYLEEKGLLKREAKRIANNVSKAYNSYKVRALEKSERGRNNEAGEGNTRILWDNLCERVYRKIEKHITLLYWSANSFMKKEGYKGDMELYSKMFVAHMLFDLALQRYDAFFIVMGERFANGHDFRNLFPEFDPASMHAWWAKLEDVLIPPEILPNFNDDDNTHRAFSVIESKLSDSVILNEAASEALAYDPVFAKQSEKIREDWANEQKEILKMKGKKYEDN